MADSLVLVPFSHCPPRLSLPTRSSSHAFRLGGEMGSGNPAEFGLPPEFKVGVLNLSDRASYLNYELELMTAKYGIVYVDVHVRGDGPEAVERVVTKCRETGVHMVLSTTEVTNKVQVRVNEVLGYPGVSELSLLYCSSKFLSRGLDLEKLWRVPMNPYVPDTAAFETMIADVPQYPAILKINLHSGCGVGVFCVKSPDDLLQRLLLIRADKEFRGVLEREREWYLDGVSPESLEEEVPFYHVEEMVRIGPGCIQYCVGGFVDENNKIHIYGIFEEMYTPSNMTFGYVTPPFNIGPNDGPRIAKYVEDYMSKLVTKGWKNQAFCAELWYRKAEDIIWMTEVNPRAAWAYTLSYGRTYNAHLIKAVTLAAAGKGSLVDDSVSPWAQWMKRKIPRGPSLVTVICVTHAGRVGDLLNFDHINELREKGRLIRPLQRPEKVLRHEDVNNAAGYWLLYVYYHADSIRELAIQEREERDGFHTFPQMGFEYPEFWPAEASFRPNSVLTQPYAQFDPVSKSPILVSPATNAPIPIPNP